jgi:hypothetical protein
VRYTQTDCGKRWNGLGGAPQKGIKAKTPASFAGASGEKHNVAQQKYYAKNNSSSKGSKRSVVGPFPVTAPVIGNLESTRMVAALVWN